MFCYCDIYRSEHEIFRGEDFKKSANQKQELPMVAMFVDGSGQNEQTLERTFHGVKVVLIFMKTCL
jgi:hypothetical protein